MEDWQKKKLKVVPEKLNQKQVLDLIDKLSPEFWIINEKEEAKRFVKDVGEMICSLNQCRADQTVYFKNITFHYKRIQRYGDSYFCSGNCVKCPACNIAPTSTLPVPQESTHSFISHPFLYFSRGARK